MRLLGVVLVVLLNSAAAATFAQGERMPRIAHVLIGTSQASHTGIESFRAGLADEGFVEGRNVLVDRRFAEGHPERYAELFYELLRSPADVLAAAGFQGITAARDASGGRIPVVGYFCGNDVKQMVATFARPGGNITGVSCLSAELATKRVELLREVLPKLRRVGLLYDPSTPKEQELVDISGAAQRLGMAVVTARASSPR